MSELVISGLFDGPLLGVNARFDAGITVVLGADSTALSTLVALVAGTRAPRRGAVRFAGHLPHASPELRRVSAVVLADETLPALGTVSDTVAAILAARADRRGARPFLDEVGLADWGGRKTRDLDASERRTLALALALTHADARLVVLYEPLAAGRALGADFVRHGVARAVEAGAVVLVATQSLDDARALGGTPTLLHHGVLTSASYAQLGSPPGADQTFVVETPDARRLAAALAREPLVRGVRWNEEQAPDTVLVFGSDTERLASAVAKVLAEESLGVRSLGISRAPLATLLASAVPAPPAYAYGAPQAYAHGAGAPYGAQPPPAYAYGGQPPTTYGAPPPATYGAPPPATYGAPPPATYGAPPVASPQAPAPLPTDPSTAAAPADQSVSLPNTFADPTRPPGGRS
jgi:ABC-type multidrug transport system ATPase subunit